MTPCNLVDIPAFRRNLLSTSGYKQAGISSGIFVCRQQSTRRHVPDFSSLTENLWTDCSSDWNVWALAVSSQRWDADQIVAWPDRFRSNDCLSAPQFGHCVDYRTGLCQPLKSCFTASSLYAFLLRLSLFIHHLISLGFISFFLPFFPYMCLSIFPIFRIFLSLQPFLYFSLSSFFVPSSLFLSVLLIYLLSQLCQPMRHSNFAAGMITE